MVLPTDDFEIFSIRINNLKFPKKFKKPRFFKKILCTPILINNITSLTSYLHRRSVFRENRNYIHDRLVFSKCENHFY